MCSPGPEASLTQLAHNADLEPGNCFSDPAMPSCNTERQWHSVGSQQWHSMGSVAAFANSTTGLGCPHTLPPELWHACQTGDAGVVVASQAAHGRHLSWGGTPHQQLCSREEQQPGGGCASGRLCPGPGAPRMAGAGLVC